MPAPGGSSSAPSDTVLPAAPAPAGTSDDAGVQVGQDPPDASPTAAPDEAGLQAGEDADTPTGAAGALPGYCSADAVLQADGCGAENECSNSIAEYCLDTTFWEPGCPAVGASPYFCGLDGNGKDHWIEDPIYCSSEEVCKFSGCSSGCVPACAQAGCPDKFECDAAGRLCLPKSCADDPSLCAADEVCHYTSAYGDARNDFADEHGCRRPSCAETETEQCSIVEICNPSASDAQYNGCQRLPCDASSDCPCGTCIDGRCAVQPGRCERHPE